MREFSVFGRYTRGSESTAHFITMFSAAVRRHTVYCVLLGLLIASVWSWRELNAVEREVFVASLVAETLAEFGLPPHIRLDNGLEERFRTVSNLNVFLASMFRGRTPLFILRLAGLRAAGLALVLFPLLAFGLTAYGGLLSGSRHLRGARIVDLRTRFARLRHFHGREGMAAMMLAAAVASGLWVVANGVNSLLFVPAALLEELCMRWPVLAQLRSPYFSGELVWVGEALAPLHLAHARAIEGAALSRVGVLAAGALLGSALGGMMFWIRFQRRWDAGAIRIGGVPIPRKREVQHKLVSGTVGSGKSVSIMSDLDQIRARGQRAIVFDTKGEYVEKFYREGIDVLLNPLDARSVRWSPFADAESPADLLSQGKSFFPEKGAHDRFWAVAGASLYASVLQQAKVHGYASNKALAQRLTSASLGEVRAAIIGTAGQRYMDEEAGAMPTNLLATLTAQLEGLNVLPDVEPEDAFSIKKFVRGEDGANRWLFMVMRAEDEAAIRPLVSAWFDIAINAVLALPTEEDGLAEHQRRRMWCVLDEVARLQQLPALAPGVREGRGKGLAFILGLQSIGDMREAYGRDRAEAILGQFATRLVLRTTEPETAAWLERLLGKAETEHTQESQSMGANSQRDGVSLNRQRREEAVALASEIQGLEDLNGFLALPGEPVARIRYEYKHRPSRNVPFIAREEEPSMLEPAVPPIPDTSNTLETGEGSVEDVVRACHEVLNQYGPAIAAEYAAELLDADRPELNAPLSEFIETALGQGSASRAG